eukprot:scaffold92107_cov17-Prasinocladus_malaysianus.AAC.2
MPLLVVVTAIETAIAMGMRGEYKMSPTHTEAAASLSSLVIEDKLVGTQRPDCGRYLAVSNRAQLKSPESATSDSSKGIRTGSGACIRGP